MTLQEVVCSNEPMFDEFHQSDTVAEAVTRALANCEQEREQLVRRLEVMADLLNGWVWETDGEHRFVYMSDSVRRLAGRDPEWHYGRTREELGNVDPHDPRQALSRAQLAAHERFGPHDFTREQFGTRIHMRTVGLPLWDAAGGFVGYCGIAYDVTSEVVERCEKDRISTERRMAQEQSSRLSSTDKMKGELTNAILSEVRHPMARVRQLAATLRAGSGWSSAVPSAIVDDLESALAEIEQSLLAVRSLASVDAL